MPSKIKNLFILAVWLILFSFGLSHSADQSFFDLYNLEVEGEIHNYLTGDFNGDQAIDVAIIYSPAGDANIRYIGLHMQKGAAGFSSGTDYLITLPPTAVQVNAADIDKDGRSEIVFIDADGVSVFKLTPTAGIAGPIRLIRLSTLYSFPLFHGIVTDAFIYDLVASPGLEIIVPSPKGYSVFERGDDGNYQILNQLSMPVFCQNAERSFSNFSGLGAAGINIGLASVTAADGNLDGRPDLYFLWDRKVCGYFQDSTGNFPQTSDFELNLFPENIDAFVQSRLVDYNGDKRPDVACTFSSGGIISAETKIRFYPADLKGRIGPKLDKEISLSDSHCNLILNDYNHDGRGELVVPAIELGAIAATKMLLMKKADLHLLIYPLNNGFPEDEPAQRINYEFRFDFNQPVPTKEITLDWTADYNGDGLMDLAFSPGSGRIQFFWGRNGEFLSRKADLEIPLDHPSEIHPLHLNQGRYYDLIIEHNLSGRLDRLTVLRNKNNKV